MKYKKCCLRADDADAVGALGTKLAAPEGGSLPRVTVEQQLDVLASAELAPRESAWR